MFTQPTVFILGAGASWHCGYPTGEDLVQKVIEKAEYIAQHLQNNYPLRRGGDPLPCPEAAIYKQLAWRLKQSNPPVIDYFLGQNKDIQEVGKQLIAWVLLECEASSWGRIHINHSPEHRKEWQKTNYKPKDDWHRFILHELTLIQDESKPETLLDNQVTFITFNYDLSLERVLYNGLSHNDLFMPDLAKKFIESPNRFLHIYGSLSEPSYNREPLSPGEINNPKFMHPYVKKNAENIRTIAGNCGKNDVVCQETLAAAREAIKNARNVYILGYGFDERNSDLLQLKELLYYNKRPHKRVMFTNYNNSERINKRASRLFFGMYNKFEGNMRVETSRKQNDEDGWYFEKSTRNVYDALAMDFDIFTD